MVSTPEELKDRIIVVNDSHLDLCFLVSNPAFATFLILG